uniref:Receptor-binding cancer antigen expressed on SiSo cells n=1 Tax=Octopus bimaculoides TaxID=37653 RepID=A0A0L8HWM8_OCTBM
MKILVNFVKKIFNIVFLILSPVRRLICRRRRHSDTPILPLNAVYSAPPTVSTSSLPPEGELQPWESWEMEDSEYKSSRNRNKSENGEQEPDIDFFQDMTPKIKKTAKQDTELGIWEENGKCWEEASEDLSWQVDATIKEKKRAEREARQLEQLRKKQEKELVRGLKKDSPFAAVRLS